MGSVSFADFLFFRAERERELLFSSFVVVIGAGVCLLRVTRVLSGLGGIRYTGFCRYGRTR